MLETLWELSPCFIALSRIFWCTADARLRVWLMEWGLCFTEGRILRSFPYCCIMLPGSRVGILSILQTQMIVYSPCCMIPQMSVGAACCNKRAEKLPWSSRLAKRLVCHLPEEMEPFSAFVEQGLLLDSYASCTLLIYLEFILYKTKQQQKKASPTHQSQPSLDLKLIHWSFWKPIPDDNPTTCTFRFFPCVFPPIFNCVNEVRICFPGVALSQQWLWPDLTASAAPRSIEQAKIRGCNPPLCPSWAFRGGKLYFLVDALRMETKPRCCIMLSVSPGMNMRNSNLPVLALLKVQWACLEGAHLLLAPTPRASAQRDA